MTKKNIIKKATVLAAVITMCSEAISVPANASGVYARSAELYASAPDLFTFDVELEEVSGNVTSAAASTKSSSSKATPITMTVGSSKTLKVSGKNNSVKWSSSDTSVCTVNQKGKVKAKKAGTAKICAKVGSKKIYYIITVVKSAQKPTSTTSTYQGKGTSKAGNASAGNTDNDTATLRIKVVDNGDGTTSFVIIQDDTNNPGSSADYAEEMLDLVNAERKKAGASALVLDDELCKAAQVRAKECGEKFSHTRPNGSDCFTVLDNYNIRYYCAGENIARGATSERVMKMWMNSSGHKKNILSSNWTKFGVGYDSETNSWVQIFTD